MTDMAGPFSQPGRGERGRIHVPGQRTDGAGAATLLAAQHSDGHWVFSLYLIGECGVQLSAGNTVGLAQAILMRAR